MSSSARSWEKKSDGEQAGGRTGKGRHADFRVSLFFGGRLFHRSSVTWFVWGVIFAAAVAGLLFGECLGSPFSHVTFSPR